jgi:hypothetical protein
MGDTILIEGKGDFFGYSFDIIGGIAHRDWQASEFQHFYIVIAIPHSHNFRRFDIQDLTKLFQTLALIGIAMIHFDIAGQSLG